MDIDAALAEADTFHPASSAGSTSIKVALLDSATNSGKRKRSTTKLENWKR